MRVVGVVQARSGSTRLPGKVLRPVAGATLLERMVERVQAASSLDEVAVATTVLPEDDVIASLCARRGWPCHRGHPTDLLDRHVQAARAMRAEVVVKVPSDCPLIDPRIIDRVVTAFEPGRHDYLGNLHPASYPDGNDVEVMPLAVLEVAHREARRPHEREHTTPFLWDQPERFRIGNVRWETGLDGSMTHRLTVDYPEDYALVRAVYDELHVPWAPPFSLAVILEFLRRRPEVFALNRHLAGINWYRHCLGELRTVGPADTVLG